MSEQTFIDRMSDQDLLKVGRRLYWVVMLLTVVVGFWYQSIALAGLILGLAQLIRWYCNKLEAVMKNQPTDAEVPEDLPDRAGAFLDSRPDDSRPDD